MSGENKNKRNCVEESQEKLIESISKNISKWRKRNELTQAQLAEKLNIETETISRLERGKHLPSLVTLHKIADQFSISIAEWRWCINNSKKTDAVTQTNLRQSYPNPYGFWHTKIRHRVHGSDTCTNFGILSSK